MIGLLIIHAAATLYMVGLIWFIQLVHYPLMGKVGRDGYTDYQRLHERYTAWAVGPAMIVELATAAWLVFERPEGIAPGLAWLGLALVVLIWLSTAVLQVPCHRKLNQGFDEPAHRRLVKTNWLRTTMWTGRGIVVLVMLA